MQRPATRVLWFKRDLRVFDHEALIEACEQGPVTPLYILEPELWQQPDMSYRHYRFLEEAIADLAQQLININLQLIIRVGKVVDVFESIASTNTILGVWSHQETWNMWTYQRDLEVLSWLKERNIPWIEKRQFGVIRKLSNRDAWSAKWNSMMARKMGAEPLNAKLVSIVSDQLPSYNALNLEKMPDQYIQKGGRKLGLETLETFLDRRGETYTKAMSSPVTAFENCSRLSPYLAFGCLSMREVYQAVIRKREEVSERPKGQKGSWPSALRSYIGRLHWHCHFIQKLEDQPEIEFQNLHPAYDELEANHEDNPEFLAAWKSGQTGFPMVDACMRALMATGWINFRMRAMLISFACHHLDLDWRSPALHLARLFLDYEPGIHYSQVQMQAATTGINAIRIYNPLKQSNDQDPTGVFLRQWIPELESVTDHFVHTPWEQEEKTSKYPRPIVDEKIARQQAASKHYSLRKSELFRAKSNQIVEKHGSRKKNRASKR